MPGRRSVAHTVAWRRWTISHAVPWHCTWSSGKAVRTAGALKAWRLLELARWWVAAILLLVLVGRRRWAAELVLLMLLLLLLLLLLRRWLLLLGRWWWTC